MKRRPEAPAGVPLNAHLGRISNIALGAAIATIAVIVVAMSFALGLMTVVDSSRLQARALAENAAAAMIFQDRQAARDLLQAAHHLPDVDFAVLYARDGRPFAGFERENTHPPASVPAQAPEGVVLGISHIVVTQPVLFQNEASGVLQLQAGLGTLYRQTAWQVFGTLVAAAVAMVLSKSLLRRLNASVLRPISGLTALTARVSERADYSVRGQGSDITELNALATGFNDMLEQIRDRDSRLALQRDHLEDELARNAAILGAIPDLLFEMDIDGRYVGYHSPRTELLAAPPEQFLGKRLSEVLPPAAAELCMGALRAADRAGLSTGTQIELALPHGTFWFELSVSRKATAPGQKPHFILLSRDITERRHAEEQIRRLAYFDSLTELPNRRSFLERVDREIVRSRRSGTRLGILFMDLDGFKNINDTMGHGMGDRCLKLTAERLREGLRPSDLVSNPNVRESELALARLGGDEFTALLIDVARPEDAWNAANRLRALMGEPLLVEGREVLLTASIGVALFPEDGEDATTLLKHADTAMYHAKSQGRDNCQFYSASLTEQAMRRMELADSLRHALERGEFHLLYQPQFDLRERRITSVEALIRWDHPDKGTISPADFIPLAEETGLIVPIGEWVLRTACESAAQWRRAGIPLCVAVNLSPVQFRSTNLLPAVRAILRSTGLPANLLELEITEGAVMQDDGQTLATLTALRDSGVRIALDDFGTGYSSMNYLKRMPLNNLKVDRSFVDGLPGNAEDLAIVRAILSMAQSLGFTVTAEGVETLEQARCLIAMDCDCLQGYYFSRPVPGAAIPALMRRSGHAAIDAIFAADVRP